MSHPQMEASMKKKMYKYVFEMWVIVSEEATNLQVTLAPQ